MDKTMNEAGNQAYCCAETVPAESHIAKLRAAGKLTLADEEHLVRLDHALLADADEATRKIIAPLAAEQVAHYEAAKARA